MNTESGRKTDVSKLCVGDTVKGKDPAIAANPKGNLMIDPEAIRRNCGKKVVFGMWNACIL